MMPKVSIVVPCYGVEKYLNRCVDALVNQTMQSIEIILVDDGSPDKVPEMCDEWAKKDNRIKVVHKENAGLGYARNSGMQYATGDYIAFVDSDDYVEITMYDALYKIAKEKNLDALFCGFKKEKALNKFVNIQECSAYTEISGESVKALIPDFIASKPYCKSEYKYEMSVWHSIYRRAIIEKYNLQFVSERDYASEDIPFQIDFLSHSYKVAFVPDIFYNYCWNGGSLTKKVSCEKFEKIKALYALLQEKSRLYDPDSLRPRRLFVGYIRTLIRTLVGMDMPVAEKKKMIRVILNDKIWDEIKLYKPSFLPFHQRLFSIFFYKKWGLMTYYYAKIMELIK